MNARPQRSQRRSAKSRRLKSECTGPSDVVTAEQTGHSSTLSSALSGTGAMVVVEAQGPG